MIYAEYLLLAWKIFINPLLHLNTLWIVLPLILVLILINLYFGRHTTELIGWNTAFTNSISLLWICVILLRHLFERYPFADLFYRSDLQNNLILLGVLVAWVVIMLFVNYFHALPKRFAFLLSGTTNVYILAYIVLSLITGFVINKHTLIAGLILFVVMVSLSRIIKSIIPASTKSKKIRSLKKTMRRKKHKKFIENLKNKFIGLFR